MVSFGGGRVGVLAGDRVVDLTDLVEPAPRLSWPPMNAVRLIADFDRLRPVVAERIDTGASTLPLSDVDLDAPVPWPHKLIAYPTNYVDHITEMKSPNRADRNGFFLKANSSLSGPNDPVVLPELDGYEIHHEAELAVYIGKGGRHISRRDARSHIFGYSCLLDITVRGPQERVMRKSFDSFCPIGPTIVTADEIADPDALDITLDVDGQRRQSANTRDLIVGVDAMVELASSVMTLVPGDVIATGTPAGVGPVLAGDELCVRIAGLDPLRVTASAGRGGSNIAFANGRP